MFLTFLRYIKQNQFLGSYKKKINYIYLNNLHRDEFIPWVVRAKGEGVKVVSIGRLPLSSDEAATLHSHPPNFSLFLSLGFRHLSLIKLISISFLRLCLKVCSMGTPEFPDLGKHCAVSDCKLIDFLPFTCDRCDQVLPFSSLNLILHYTPQTCEFVN